MNQLYKNKLTKKEELRDLIVNGISQEDLENNYDYSKITDMSFMFDDCENLKEIPLIDTSKVTNMQGMFKNCYSLKEIPLLDTSNVTNMGGMFFNCRSLKTIPQLNTSNVTNMYSMFNGCSNFKKIPLLDTSKVTNMVGLFYSCFDLKTIPLLDTSNVTNMQGMFYYCSNLKTIPQLNTSNVTNMNSMFHSCRSLKEIPLLNTNNVTNMESMFEDCFNLEKEIDLDMTSIVNNNNMYEKCYTLIKNIDKKNIIDALNIPEIKTTILEEFQNNKTTTFLKYSNLPIINKDMDIFKSAIELLDEKKLKEKSFLQIFQNMDAKARMNVSLITKIVNNGHPNLLTYLTPKILKNTLENVINIDKVILNNFQFFKYKFNEYWPQYLKDDKKFMFEIIKKDPLFYLNLKEEFQKDKEFILLVLNNIIKRHSYLEEQPFVGLYQQITTIKGNYEFTNHFNDRNIVKIYKIIKDILSENKLLNSIYKEGSDFFENNINNNKLQKYIKQKTCGSRIILTPQEKENYEINKDVVKIINEWKHIDEKFLNELSQIKVLEKEKEKEPQIRIAKDFELII